MLLDQPGLKRFGQRSEGEAKVFRHRGNGKTIRQDPPVLERSAS